MHARGFAALPGLCAERAAAGAYVGDNLLQAQERVISQERLIDRTVDRPIQVPNERIVEEVLTCPSTLGQCPPQWASAAKHGLGTDATSRPHLLALIICLDYGAFSPGRAWVCRNLRSTQGSPSPCAPLRREYGWREGGPHTPTQRARHFPDVKRRVQVVERTKLVEKNMMTEQPVIQQVRQCFQIQLILAPVLSIAHISGCSPG